MFRKSSLLGSSALSSAPQTTYADIRGEDIMSDPRVIADVRAEFEDRGIYISDDEELMRKFYDDQTFSKLNATVGPFNAYQRAEAATPESRARQARLRDAHNKLPAFFQTGGVGAGTALPSYGKALILDPINFVGGFVGAGGKGVVKAVQAARLAGSSTTMAGARAGAVRGAVAEGVLGAGFGGVYSVGQQNVDIKLGLQDQFSFGRLAADVAGEAAFGAGIGAGIGGTAGAISGAIRGTGPGPAQPAPSAPEQPTVSAPEITPQEEVAELRRDAAEAAARGDFDAEDDLLEEANSLEASAATFDLDGFDVPEDAPAATSTATPEQAEAAPASEPATPAQTEGAATDAPEEAAPAKAKDTKPKGNPSSKAKKMADEAGLDLSVDKRKNVYKDPEIEAYVIRREQLSNTPASAGLSKVDLDAILAERALTAEASTPSAAEVAVSTVLNKEKVEDATGEAVSEAAIEANIAKEAEAAGLPVEDVRAANKALEEALVADSTALVNRVSQLLPAEIARLKQRVAALQRGGTGAADAATQALDEIFAGRKISGQTPERVADRTAKSAEKMATSENAGRSLTDNIDPLTGRTTRKPGRYQWMFAKGFRPPTSASVARNYAEELAKKSLDSDGKVIVGDDAYGRSMATDVRNYDDLAPSEQDAFNEKLEQLINRGKEEAEARTQAMAFVNRLRKQEIAELTAADGGVGITAQNGVVVYMNRSRVQALTGSGRIEEIDRGNFIIYDATLDRSFAGADFDDAKEVLAKFHQNNELDRVTRDAEQAQREIAINEFIDANGTTHIDLGATADRVGAASYPDLPVEKADLVLTVAYVGPGKIDRPVRQIGRGQIERGDGFRELIGAPRDGQVMEPRFDPSNWKAYFLPAEKPTKGKYARLAAAVKEATPIDTNRMNLPGTVYSLDAAFAGPPQLKDIADVELPKPETAEEQAMFKLFIDEGTPLNTYADLLKRESTMLRADLGTGNARQLAARAIMMYSYMSRVLPQGIIMPQGTRFAAYNALDAIFKGHNTKTLDVVKRILSGIQSDGAPTFARLGEVDAKDRSTVAGRYRAAAATTDEIGVEQQEFLSGGTIELNPDGQFHPAHVMLHEMAHWSVDYVLTPKVKGAFFAELANYIDDLGNLRLDKIGLSGAPQGLDVGKNFHEVFANMFTKWGSDKVFRRALSESRNTFFEKLKDVFRKLFDFFMSGGVPEQFDPMFSNILSDTQRLEYRLNDFDRPPKTNDGVHIRKRYGELTQLRNEWLEARDFGKSYEPVMRKFMRFVFGQTNTSAQNKYLADRAGGEVYGNNTGTFLPLKPIRFSLIRDMNELNDMTKTYATDERFASGLAAEQEDLLFTFNDYAPDVYERITREIDDDGLIGKLLTRMENRYAHEYQLKESGQSQQSRVRNRKRSERNKRDAAANQLTTGQVTDSVKQVKKDRAAQAVGSAFYKGNLEKGNEKFDAALDANDIPNDASMDELVNMFSFGEGDTMGKREKLIAQKMKRMADAEPPASKQRGKYDDGSTPRQLFRKMVLAADRNDLTDFYEILGAYQRAGGKENLAPQDSVVDNLRIREARQNGLSLDGISFSARPQLRSLQRKMQVRRDPEMTATMRQLFFRVMNMVGATNEQANGPIRNEVLANILGEEASQLGKAAMTDASASFKGMRSELRKIAQGLTRGTDDDPVRDVVRMAIRASNDMPFKSINGRPADDFMTDAVVELLAGRSNFENVFPQSPDRAAFLRSARSYMDRSAYLVNGLIANGDLKKSYPGLMKYGDMFASKKRPIASSYGVGAAVPPPVAADAFSEALEQGTEALRLGIQRFTKGAFNIMPNGLPAALYVPVRKGTPVDNNGRVQTEGMFGLATYVSSEPDGALSVKTADTMPRTKEGEERAADLIDRLELLDEKLLQLRGQQASAETSADAIDLRNEMVSLFEQREGMIQALVKTGKSFDDVAPVVTSASRVANFQQNAVYRADDELVRLMQSAVGQKDERALIQFGQSINESIDGDDLYNLAVDVLERSGMSESAARASINNDLMAAGYEGIIGTTERKGAALPVIAIFDSDQVRSLKSPDLLAAPDEDGVVKAGLGAEFWELVASDLKLPPSSAGAVEDYLRLNEVAPAVAEAVSNIVTNSRESTRSGMDRMFRSLFDGAEQRLNKAGMKKLADKFANFTAEHTRMTGNIIMPLLEGVKREGYGIVGLNNLPGMPANFLSKVGNYMTTAAQGNKVMGFAFKEPAPLQRIRAAMIDPSKTSELRNDQERQMFSALRDNFQGQLRRMKDAGILVGDLGPDYFPQVWNPEIVRRDEKGFKSLMFAYVKQERANAGTTISNDDAQAFADKVFNNITGNDTGVVDFDSPSSLIDSTDFSRLLRFHQAAPELLESAQKYQEQSLLATVVRYFDETERVIQQADHFGLNGHGIADYAKAAQLGEEGIIELLQTDKNFAANRTVIGPDGVQAAEGKETITISMLPPKAANDFGKEAVRVGRTDPAAARRILMDAYRGTRGEPPITYERRVDAIVDALADFKGVPAQIDPDDLNAIDGFAKLMMRRPADNASQAMRGTSRAFRAFQNVTLLSYATISSFSDIAMPIIRSGDFKAAWQGWSKYLGDKEYRDTIRRIGVAMDGITHERMAQLIGDGNNILQSTFFKLTGLTPWTNMQRAGAAAIGEHGLRHHMEAIKKMGIGAKDSPAYLRHKRELKKFGMTYEADQPIPKLGGGTDADHAFERAVIRFTDATIFSPKPHDMPLFASNPWGAMAYQLKSFSIMYGRFAKEMLVDETGEAWKAIRAGDYGTAAQYMKKPALLMTLGPAVAAGSIAGKDLVMARGGEEGKSVGINETTRFSNIVGPEWSDEQLDAIAGWYTTAFMQAGGLGLLGDIFRTTVEQADNGAYGRQRVAEAILGPTYGLVFGDGMSVFAGVADAGSELMGGDVTPGRQRQAIREVVGRTPFLGGNRVFKEGIVDGFKPTEGKSSGVGGSAYKRTTYGTTEF